MNDIFEKLEHDYKSFAFVEADGIYSLYVGTLHEVKAIDDLHDLYKKTKKEIFFSLPFNVMREKGYEALGAEPILAMPIDHHFSIDEDLLQSKGNSILQLKGDVNASISDQDFEDLVVRLQKEHVAAGDATQVVISRYFSGAFEDISLAHLINLFYRMSQTGGQYRTVFFANRESEDPRHHHYLLAATPECHLRVSEEKATMMPIAGTFRKWGFDQGLKEDLAAFLRDQKEINELFQVVDEEMKMMGTICPDGGHIEGPFLREVGAVIHTEYKLTGKKGLSALQALKRSCHAPTLVGGPLESAARIIAHHEGESRRYYGGEIGLYNGENDTVDCSIFIRGVEIFSDKTFRVQAGAGVVRDSDPVSEMKETIAKAQGVMNILQQKESSFASVVSEDILAEMAPILEERNKRLSHFWCRQQAPIKPSQLLKGLSVTIVNNEDDFAFMIAHLLRYQGCDVRVVDTYDYNQDLHKSAVTLLGPGPGDINDLGNERMVVLNQIVKELFERNALMIGVCLGHQALAKYLGLSVELQGENTQGVQRLVPVFGRSYALGFYNSFSPINGQASQKVSYDLDGNGRVLAMQGDHFMGMQFHPESILSEKGHEILVEGLIRLRLTRSA